jgi:glutathione S-transferase
MSSTALMEEKASSKPASAVTAKLYGLPGAAPSYSAELMLRHKGIPYRRVNLTPMLHRRTLARKGFPGITAPALELDGRPVQTNRAIARALDRLVPTPRLFPADLVARASVLEAERFADEVLQHATRRMMLWSLTRKPDSVTPNPALGPLAVPGNRFLRAALMPRVFRLYGVTDEVIRADFESLPGMLDRLDGYVIASVLNSTELNAADFEVAPLIAALFGLEDQRDEIANRPVAMLVHRLLPS